MLGIPCPLKLILGRHLSLLRFKHQHSRSSHRKNESRGATVWVTGEGRGVNCRSGQDFQQGASSQPRVEHQLPRCLLGRGSAPGRQGATAPQLPVSLSDSAGYSAPSSRGRSFGMDVCVAAVFSSWLPGLGDESAECAWRT